MRKPPQKLPPRFSVDMLDARIFLPRERELVPDLPWVEGEGRDGCWIGCLFRDVVQLLGESDSIGAALVGLPLHHR